MRIGIAGPVATEDVARYLDADVASLPRGFSGAPLLGTLIGTLIEMGHEVSVFTLDRALEPGAEPLVVTGKSGFRIYYGGYRARSFRPNGARPGRMVDFFRLERAVLRRAMVSDRPEVVHAHWTYEYALAAVAAGIPHVITCHDSPIQVLRYMPNLYRLGRYFMARMVFRRARALSAVSSYLKSEVSRYAGVPIAIVPNPLPSSLVTQVRPAAVDRPRREAPRIAMILNGWGRRKNPEVGLRAFALLRRVYPAATLHLYGYDFGPGEAAEIWATRQRLKDSVSFHGSRGHKQLLDDLEQTDMLLHPAREETLGMVIVEAMVLGVPVVAGERSGAVPWVLDHGRAGILTDVENPAAVSQAMLDLLANPERYRRLVADAQMRALAEFSPRAVAESYLDLYRKAVGEQARMP